MLSLQIDYTYDYQISVKARWWVVEISLIWDIVLKNPLINECSRTFRTETTLRVQSHIQSHLNLSHRVTVASWVQFESLSTYRFESSQGFESGQCFESNLHFTLGYSLLKCKVDYGLCSVGGLAKGRRKLFSAISHSSELKEKIKV